MCTGWHISPPSPSPPLKSLSSSDSTCRGPFHQTCDLQKPLLSKKSTCRSPFYQETRPDEAPFIQNLNLLRHLTTRPLEMIGYPSHRELLSGAQGQNVLRGVRGAVLALVCSAIKYQHLCRAEPSFNSLRGIGSGLWRFRHCLLPYAHKS